MGDTRVIDRIERGNQTNDASGRLADDAYSSLRRNGSDRNGSDSGRSNSRFDNPYDHVTNAANMLQEFESLKNKSADEKIRIQHADGQIKEITVGERRKSLLEEVQKEFNSAINAADRIDQSKVASTLFSVREQQQTARTQEERERLIKQEEILEAMKHAPGVTRFAYASFLADAGQFTEAKKLMDKAAELDVEAKNDKAFQEVYRAVETAMNEQHDKATMGHNPFAALNSANEKAAAGDLKGAEEDYKAAIAQADQYKAKDLLAELKLLEDMKKNAKDDRELSMLQEQEQLLSGLLHGSAITRIAFGEFLNNQKRYDEAKIALMEAATLSPDLVKGNAEFNALMQTAANKGKAPEPFNNPFDHLDKFQKAFDSGNVAQARAELQAAIREADKIDRKLMQENKRVIDEQLKEERDPAKRKNLMDMRNAYDGFDHAAAFCRIALARFEIAYKNYNSAQSLLRQAERMDPELARKPEMEMSKLKEAAVEPSTWEKIWNTTKSVLKELACDAVAILAGAGTVILTGWSGPGAILAGGAAGAAAYTGMKALMGEEIHWYTPLWGALDGVSGGAAALARTALVKTAGGVVTKEMASSAVLKAGGNVAALEGLEGLKMAQTAQTLSKEGLKAMGREVGMLSRWGARIPFTSLGSAEYRAALSAYRGLKYTNTAVKLGVDAGTALTASGIYRLGHDGVKFANGEYADFGDFMSNYAGNVATDTLLGTTVGGIFGRFVGNTATNGFIGKYTGLGTLATRVESLTPAIAGSWVASSPQWARAYAEEQKLKNEIEPMLEYLQRPVATRAELKERYFFTPGTNNYPVEQPQPAGR